MRDFTIATGEALRKKGLVEYDGSTRDLIITPEGELVKHMLEKKRSHGN